MENINNKQHKPNFIKGIGFILVFFAMSCQNKNINTEASLDKKMNTLNLYYSKRHVKWQIKGAEVTNTNDNNNQKNIKIEIIDKLNLSYKEPFEKMTKTIYSGSKFSVFCEIKNNKIVPNSPSVAIENDIINFRIKKIVGNKESFNFEQIELYYDELMVFPEKFKVNDSWEIVLNEKLELVDLIQH